MDMLCILPQRDSEDRKFLRKKAIHRMALIYVGADQVLVLDAELDKFTHEGNPRELTDALVSCARWSGRCWTLEEGALARKCFFQFKDRARELTSYNNSTAQTVIEILRFPWRTLKIFLPYTVIGPDVGHEWYESPPRGISYNFAHDYLRFELAAAVRLSAQTNVGHARRVAARRAPDRELQVLKLIRTWNEVGRRSTTRPEDIHPIMANLTDFSAAQIMALDSPMLRTKIITHCIGEFPLDMLWTPCARPQANEDSADRWIPSVPGPEPLVEYALLSSTSKGLVVDAEHISPPETYLVPRGMVHPRFCFYWRNACHREIWYVVECTISEDDAFPRSESETACLILGSDTSERSAKSSKGMLRGARLLVTKDNSETSDLYLRYDCPIICRIQRYPPDIEQRHDTPIMTVQRVPLTLSRQLVIESNFDPKDRKRFNMRSRDFYYGQGMVFIDRIITLSGITPGVMLAVFMVGG